GIGTLERRIEKLHTIGLDAEIKALNESVASIRKKIDDTSPVGNVFHEIEDLRDSRARQLKDFEIRLQDAGQTAKKLLWITPPSDPQTTQRLSSDLQAVIENIRRAKMAAVYPANYRDYQGSVTIRDLHATIQPDRFQTAENIIRILEPELRDLELQHAELQGFVNSRDSGQPPSEEDEYFLALT